MTEQFLPFYSTLHPQRDLLQPYLPRCGEQEAQGRCTQFQERKHASLTLGLLALLKLSLRPPKRGLMQRPTKTSGFLASELTKG